MPEIRYEQAVYGSFPFWHRGYDLLAHSPGCHEAWLKAFRAVCERYGEPSRTGDDASGALFCLRLPENGPWLIVGVCPQGQDDHGRPGALAFHGLFVQAHEFRRAGFDPFAFRDCLRCDWESEAQTLISGRVTVEPEPPIAKASVEDPVIHRIAHALAHRQRVVIEAVEPATELARSVWRCLPPRVRRRRDLATFAFSNANRFDLLVLPRLTGVELDGSYRTLDRLRDPASGTREHAWRPPARWIAGSAVVGLALVIALTWWLWPGPEGPPSAEELTAIGGTDARPDREVGSGAAAVRSQPVRAAFRAEPPLGEDERQMIVEGLLDFASRFGMIEASEMNAGDISDPTPLILRLTERLRYRGRWLTPQEREILALEANGERFLEWHRHLEHFAGDRPLPPDFDAGPLRWQLAVLAWSFHVEPHPHLAATEIPFAVADALALPWPVRPTPLADRFPALDDYGRFFSRLPRR